MSDHSSIDANLEEELTPLPEFPQTPSLDKIETLTQSVVEKVVRELLPSIAERVIKEELTRLISEENQS